MKLLFISDKLPIDKDFVPLTDLLDLTCIFAGAQTDDNDVYNDHAMSLGKKNSTLLRRAAQRGNQNTTYYVCMPEGAIEQWLNEIVEFKYMSKTLEVKREMLVKLFGVDYPGWTPVRPALPTVLFFYCTHIHVVSEKSITALKDITRT